MSVFCTNCGQSSAGGSFCASCGAKLVTAGAAQPAAGGAGTGAAAQGLRGLESAVGVTALDIARDGTAAILLFVALFLPWDFTYDATEHVGVVLVTLTSLASLSLAYLPRLGVTPPAWTAATGRTVRLLLNVPYLVALVAALAQDAFTSGGNGLGLALAFGLAGALLAATPREAELDDASDALGEYCGAE